MYTTPFEYHRAGSVDEALALLEQFGDEAKLVAGGHSLIPVMKLRFAQPAHLIDIRRIQGMSGIRENGDGLVIGALTTYRELESSDLLRQRVPVLAECASEVGDLQVRNLGTIGGSLAHADPAADMPATILALGATLVARGRAGERRIPADRFFVAMMTSALEEREILTEIHVPLPPARTGSAYVKHAHPASGYALCGVAALVTLGDGGGIERVRVGITGIGVKAVRSTGVEQALVGSDGSVDAIAAAASHAAEALELRADEPGANGYNGHLAQVFTKRALTRAVERARSG
jgi:aerobic carbon-monoxide dehydrogenase medium subunit